MMGTATKTLQKRTIFIVPKQFLSDNAVWRILENEYTVNGSVSINQGVKQLSIDELEMIKREEVLCIELNIRNHTLIRKPVKVI